MMSYDDEIKVLEQLTHGRRSQSRGYIQSQSNSYSTPNSKDMLHTASGKSQAIYKITSFGKGGKSITGNMSYISRRGQLELEDQDGNFIKSTKEQRSLINDWSVDFAKNKRSRDTMHLMLSTPPGSNRDSARRAAKEFLEIQYKSEGHEYVFAAHTDTKHPHIHAVIKMVSCYGTKLNPRKAHIREARHKYAEICRSHGIKVEASSRVERGLPGPSARSVFVQMRKNNRKPKADLNLIDKIRKERTLCELPRHPSADKMLIRNQIIRKRYADMAKAMTQKAKIQLEQDQKLKYFKAAYALDTYAKAMPIEINRGDKLHKQLNSKPGLSRDRTKEQSLDQYHAVINGLKDDKGIYHSPKELILNSFKKSAMAPSNRDKGLEMEIDYDM